MSKKKQDNFLQKAEKIYFSNDNSSLLEFLLKHKDKYEINNQQDNKIFNHLLGFGYAFQNKLSELEKHCKASIAIEPNPLDYYFLLTFTHLSLREYDQMLKTSEKFIELFDKMKSPELNYTFTDSHRCQVYNFIGSAHMELGNKEKAINYFSQAIKIEKENHLPYLNLANLYINNKEYTHAKEIIQNGLKVCSQIQELRLLEKSLTERPSVSACMIVKNEEELLPECLDSIRDWVDEIIVVDTGSDDKTVEIAKSYGAKVYHQEWEGNFSKHRNYSTSLATSDWVFIIDADERMVSEDVPTLLKTLQNKNVDIVSISVFNVYGNREQTTTFLPSVRFWRRSVNLKYTGIVHNLLDINMEQPIVRVGARLKHLGYDLSKEKMHQKFVRTKELLEKQLKENPENAFALYNYAQILKADRSIGDTYPLHNNELIIDSARKAVELTNPNEKKERHIHLMCLDQVAWGYFHAQEYDNALEYAHKALNVKPAYLDPLLLIGHIFAQQKIWDKAKDGYKTYLKCQAEYSPESETDSIILSHIDDRASANYSLGLIAEKEQDLSLAKSYYLKSIEADSGFIETNSRLAQLYMRENDLVNSKKHFLQQIELSHTTGDTLLGLALICQNENNFDEADKYYKEAIGLEEFNSRAKLEYAKFLFITKRIDQAKQILKTVAETCDEPKTCQTIGDIYFQVGLFKEASNSYQQIKAPSAELLNNIGNCYFKLEQFDDAESFYNKALKFENHPNVTLRNIGIVQFKLGNHKTAIFNLEQYLHLNSKDYTIIPVLADLYKMEKMYNKALQQYEILLQIEPNNIGLIYALSDCYLLMGHKDSAIVGFQRILTLKPDYKPAQEQINRLTSPILTN